MTSSYIHSLTQQTLLEHFLWAVASGRAEGVMKQAPQIPMDREQALGRVVRVGHPEALKGDGPYQSHLEGQEGLT